MKQSAAVYLQLEVICFDTNFLI